MAMPAVITVLKQKDSVSFTESNVKVDDLKTIKLSKYSQEKRVHGWQNIIT